MYLQGQLQNIFEALYQLGWVHHMLQISWRPMLQQPLTPLQYKKLMHTSQTSPQHLKSQLQSLNTLQLQHLTMCVAQELASLKEKRVLH